MIRAVLFDVGGTLHIAVKDPRQELLFSGIVLEKLSAIGFPLPIDAASLVESLHRNAEEYKHWSEVHRRELPNDQIWSQYYLKEFCIPAESLVPISEELSVLYDAVRVRNEPRPHMQETLRELKTMGMHLGVISNIISHTFVPQLLRDYSIDGDMECVILSSDVGIRKPAAAIFQAAAERIGIPVEEMAYVGDTLSRDVLGCRNAGAGLSIQIRNPSMAHRDKDFMQTDLHPDYLIQDLSEIPGIIQAYNRAKN